jgi:Uma2 family endonuclease
MGRMTAERIPTSRHPMSVDDYFALERGRKVRHEFHGPGRIVAMAGGTANHARIGLNIAAELRAAFAGRPCEAFGSDMRLKASTAGKYFYPDASATCGGSDIVRENGLESLANPIVLVEVLSASTAQFDWGVKLEAYRSIATLDTYVILNQIEARATLISRSRDDTGWRIEQVVGLDAIVKLPAIGVEIPMSAIYRDVVFPPPQVPPAPPPPPLDEDGNALAQEP